MLNALVCSCMDLKNAKKISNETKPILKVKNSIKEYVILCCGLALVLVSMPMGGSGGGAPPPPWCIGYKTTSFIIIISPPTGIFLSGGGQGGIGPP